MHRLYGTPKVDKGRAGKQVQERKEVVYVPVQRYDLPHEANCETAVQNGMS